MKRKTPICHGFLVVALAPKTLAPVPYSAHKSLVAAHKALSAARKSGVNAEIRETRYSH
jgi:hypothetical protein